MPVVSSHVSVGTTQVKIVNPSASMQHVILHNHEHSSSRNIYVNGNGVTINTGLHIPDTNTIQFDLYPGDDLWAISDTAGGATLHVMVIRN
jgi:hypothetical protein